MKSLALCALATTALALAGCHHDSGEVATKPAASAQKSPVSAAAAHLPSVSASASKPGEFGRSRLAAEQPPSLNAHAVRNIAPFPTTGVATCDSYAKVVEQCINVHTHGIDRVHLRIAFSRAVKGWKKSLSAGTSDTTVAKQCAAFRQSYTPKLNAVGCTGI